MQISGVALVEYFIALLWIFQPPITLCHLVYHPKSMDHTSLEQSKPSLSVQVCIFVGLPTLHKFLLLCFVCEGEGKHIAVSGNLASLLRELTYHMGSHSVTCHLTEVTLSPLPQLKLILDLATPEGCKAELTWWLVKHRGGLPVQRWSPIPGLTGFDIEQLRWCDQWCYHYFVHGVYRYSINKIAMVCIQCIAQTTVQSCLAYIRFRPHSVILDSI